MGAHDFTNFYAVEPRKKMVPMQEAYRKLVDDALWEYGHDGYNGTISTTSGCVRALPQAVTMTQARRLIQQYWDYEDNSYAWEAHRDGYGPKPRKRVENPFGRVEVEKWGAALALEIKASAKSKRGWLFFGLAAS